MRTPGRALSAAALPTDLFAPEVIADPYGWFGRLREVDPVHWNDRFGMWLVTGQPEVAWILRRHDLFSSAVIRGDSAPAYPPVDRADLPLFDEIRGFRSAQLVEKDRPEHLRQRSVVHSYFTPTAMERWRPFVRAAVEELFDGIEARGTGGSGGVMDVLDELAAPLPVRIIAEMMGVPYRDRDRLRAMADGILYINRGESWRLRPLAEAIRGIVDYAAPLVEERIGGDGDDFISVLAGGEIDGAFTRHEVLVNTGLLLFAGHETTMNLICNGLLALIRHPEEWERLRADPAGMARLATEECLRYDPPVKSTQRVAAADIAVAELTGRQAGGRGCGRAAVQAERDERPPPDHPHRGPHPLDHRGCEPRSAGVRGSRRVRHWQAAESARVLRGGDSLLPGGHPGPGRGAGGAARPGRAVQPLRDPGRRRRVPAQSPVPFGQVAAGQVVDVSAGPVRPPRIDVDPARCVSNAMCLALAPGVFAHNDNYQSEAVDPAGGSLAEILEAARNCPTEAITVADADTGRTLFP